MKCTLGSSVDLVQCQCGEERDCGGSQINVVDIAVKSSSFRFVAVYVPNDQTDRVSFFYRLLGLFQLNVSRFILIEHWNAIHELQHR